MYDISVRLCDQECELRSNFYNLDLYAKENTDIMNILHHPLCYVSSCSYVDLPGSYFVCEIEYDPNVHDEINYQSSKLYQDFLRLGFPYTMSWELGYSRKRLKDLTRLLIGTTL